MKTYGLIGKTLSHSFSKNYFQQKFKKEAIDACYELYELATIELFPEFLRKHSPHGLNITIPYKESIIPYLDGLSEEAAAIGAVNVVVCKGEKTVGYNSDVEGFKQSFVDFVGKKEVVSALILGTGGSAKAVVYGLMSLYPSIKITSVSRHPRTPDQISYDALMETDLCEYDVLIQTTPVGMYPDSANSPLFPYEKIRASHLVFDLVYNPKETVFLQKAKAQGASTRNGLQMLHLQAEKAWEYWQKDDL